MARIKQFPLSFYSRDSTQNLFSLKLTKILTQLCDVLWRIKITHKIN